MQLDPVRKAELERAYRATRYCVPALQLVLRIGEHSPALDALLRDNGLESWAFISAANPYSGVLCDYENRARHQNLLDALVGQPFWEGSGEPDSPGWLPEPSVLVLGIARDAALVLAQRFEQNAIVSGKLGEAAALIWAV
ncbi:Protein of unknown function [Andreprevotia lacus DSM 23236]|jgi:hypothetical protein|uniref:DUF3293 domain-containing protein n=1 Tax=Andreprevotia lacus DSM 23236 TaxID=1121001 RepID=A0A1W1XF49_9NEIS|nr:DUF3293 domain-containing protein [Andreprevotia lacus]SMC22248.1 Protein of unknown function [Andreprevotia lacus DSM 23236]